MEQVSSAYAYPTRSYSLRVATPEGVADDLWSASSLSLSALMKSLMSETSASMEETFEAETSPPTLISASGTRRMPWSPAALQRESSNRSTPMYARSETSEGSAIPSMHRMRPNPAASLRRMTVSTRRRESRLSSNAFGTTTISADSSIVRSSGRGSLTTSMPSLTAGADFIPDEAVVRRPSSRGTSFPRIVRILPFSVTEMPDPDERSDVRTAGVESLGPSFSLAYSQILPLWDLAMTSNMPPPTDAMNMKILIERNAVPYPRREPTCSTNAGSRYWRRWYSRSTRRSI